VARVAKYVRLTVRPESEADLLASLARIREASQQESGTHLWTLHSERGTPHTYAMYEIYADDDAAVEHEHLTELVELLARLPELLVGPPELTVLDEMPS
jgi:quinol monooxygenase YgiN